MYDSINVSKLSVHWPKGMETVSAIEPSVGALPPPDAVGDDPLAAGAAELDAAEYQYKCK